MTNKKLINTLIALKKETCLIPLLRTQRDRANKATEVKNTIDAILNDLRKVKNDK